MTLISKKWLDEIREVTKTLMATPSISRSGNAETRCAEKIMELLLQHYPDTDKVPDFDPVFWNTGDERKNVACLLKSRNPHNEGRTIILMGHLDTVGIENFSRFGDSDIAFQPYALADAIKLSLEEKSRVAALDDSEQSALRDLQTGEWIFGRGSLDMKSGLAINLSVFREFARQQENGQRLIDEFAGNLLLLVCPDEETESVGILSAVLELLKLREQENLTYIGVINMDYTAPRGTEEDVRYIYSGTVGKLLPSFYILGVRTHVGEIFRGLDASHIAAELIRYINLNAEWIDAWQGTIGSESITDVAPPPIALQMRELKSSYNVETAGEAFVYANWLVLKLTPEEAIAKMKEAARVALAAVYDKLADAHAHFTSLGGQAPAPPSWTGPILTYEALLHEAGRRWEAENREGHLSDWLRGRAESLKSSAQDVRQLSRMLVAELVKIAGLNGPAVITFFSPPYYPSVQPRENEIMMAVSSVLHGTEQPIQICGHYPYISDLSYFQLDPKVEIDSLRKNMPLFDLMDSSGKTYYHLDSEKLESIRALNCPVVNIGAFGRDAHGLYERVHMPYSFEVLPELIFRTIAKCLTGSEA